MLQGLTRPLKSEESKHTANLLSAFSFCLLCLVLGVDDTYALLFKLNQTSIHRVDWIWDSLSPIKTTRKSCDENNLSLRIRVAPNRIKQARLFFFTEPSGLKDILATLGSHSWTLH